MAKGTCEYCGQSGKLEMFLGVNYCEQCYHAIRNFHLEPQKSMDYFNRIPANHATPKAMQEVSERIEHLNSINESKQRELNKQEFAHSFHEYYEYDVVTILNEDHGQIDREKMNEILNSYSSKGWKLHSIYSNELGKNALNILGFGTNSTACEDVLVFERRIISNENR